MKKGGIFLTHSGDREAYLRLLSQHYPTIREASAQIIHLRAVLGLPKGTEHFLSDLHGEHAAFLHMLHNASGVIKSKIRDLYQNMLPAHERDLLCTLVYYPEEKLALLRRQGVLCDEWYRITLYRLIEVCRLLSGKYTRVHIREALPDDLGGVLEELLARDDSRDKQAYYEEIMRSILETGQGDAMIVALSRTIQYLAIDRLHIIGDIYDRGPRADLILDALIGYHQVDVQWGNHDIVWMGAAALCEACIAQVVVTSVKYGNLDTLEVGYGISLRPLATMAMEVYADDPCDAFRPHENGEALQEDEMQIARMHKAAAVLEFKLEGQLIARHPEYGMEDRRLLHRVDPAAGTVRIGERTVPLRSCRFPTVDWNDPYALSPQEREVMDRLVTAFAHSEKLQRHVRFLYSAGSMYLRCNGNLLYHGCIPLTPEGDFAPIPLPCAGGEAPPVGPEAIDRADRLARQGFFARAGSRARMDGQDFLWYLGCGPYSPLFGKDRMATFERCFVADRETWKETKNLYYSLLDDERMARRILAAFGLSPDRGHIVNGHVPVQLKKGESPVKANGRLLVIDGGLSRAYQPVTGIAGYTLIFNSHELSLVAHQPFESTARAITEEQDIHSVQTVVEKMPRRLLVSDTDQGDELRGRIADLEELLCAYREGRVKEARAGR